MTLFQARESCKSASREFIELSLHRCSTKAMLSVEGLSSRKNLNSSQVHQQPTFMIQKLSKGFHQRRFQSSDEPYTMLLRSQPRNKVNRDRQKQRQNQGKFKIPYPAPIQNYCRKSKHILEPTKIVIQEVKHNDKFHVIDQSFIQSSLFELFPDLSKINDSKSVFFGDHTRQSTADKLMILQELYQQNVLENMNKQKQENNPSNTKCYNRQNAKVACTFILVLIILLAKLI